jgi:aminoglycoside phosphotransferase family enzyme
MKRWNCLSLIMLSLLTACVSKEKQEVKAAQLAQQRFNEVDLTTPDSYPQFDNCDELDQAKDCFYQQLHELIQQRLIDRKIQGLDKDIDTLMATITISKEGVIAFKGIDNNDSTRFYHRIDSMLQISLKDLGHIAPATKQGIPIFSTYKLPVVLAPIPVD